VVLAQAGAKVVLVACDFHLPSADRYFDADSTTGLSDVLAGTGDLAAAFRQPSGFDNLWVIASGSLPPNPSELLGSDTMGDLLADLRKTADWVILDTAPVLAAADAAAVTRWADGVLVVARVGTSRRDSSRAGHEQLKNVGARILGLAVWGPVDKLAAHGYYGYRSSSGGPS
jgi:capsular exopolysaccharide synthesis family protein